MFLHPMRRIVMLIRDNLAQMRQVESGASPDRRQAGGSSRAAKKDPTLTKIGAEFSRFDIEKSRGGYLVFNRGSSDPVARLRPDDVAIRALPSLPIRLFSKRLGARYQPLPTGELLLWGATAYGLRSAR
jgi:hypothetical protein